MFGITRIEGKPWCEYLFIVMLVNFCFQVVLGRLFRDYLSSFDSFQVLAWAVSWRKNKCLVTSKLSMSPALRSSKTRPDFGIMTGVLSNWVRIVLGHFFWEYIWTFDAIAKCLTSSFLFLKPHLGHDELHKRKNPGVNNCFHRNVSQFLLSSCRWALFLRIHLNFWCRFKVPERWLFDFKTSFGTWWTP